MNMIIPLGAAVAFAATIGAALHGLLATIASIAASLPL